MQSPKTILTRRIHKAAKVGILGIGSDLRADDAAGILVAQQLEKIIAEKKIQKQIRIFIGATAPENLTGEIKRFAPDHLLIIDAAELGLKPGQTKIMDPKDIAGITFCTHNLPLSVMIDYLRQSNPFEVTVIGIQPRTLTVNAAPSKEVLKTVDSLAQTILNSLAKTFGTSK